MANPTKSASAVFALVQAVAVAMSPTSVTLRPSSSQQFTAQVTGSSNASVNWSIAPALGTIDSTGRYVAPASVLTAQTVTVTAQSVADPTQSANGIVALAPPVTVSVTPTNAALTISETQQFAATVSGSSNSAVSWTLSPAVGSISASGLYTAPASLSGLQTVTVTATSAADPTKSASASIALAPVTVSISPLTSSLGASQTQQFGTRVRGSSNTGVIWSISPAVGSISSAGLYTAPAIISKAQSVTVTATSAADPTKSASAIISLVPSVTVSLMPTTVSLTGSQWQQFTATVGASSNSGVTWSVNPAVGTLSSAGLYTAPATIASAQSVTVTATSVADPTKSASASVALAQTVTVSVTPASVSLGASQTQQFTAAVGGSANTGVTWSVSPAVGTLSSTGLYTAPATIAGAQSVTVTATSVADPTKSAGASVALTPTVTVSITPANVSLGVSQTQQFTASVGGSANTGVTWSVSPSVGTLSSAGLYTAPATLAGAQIVTVTATSVADPTKSSSASIALTPPVSVSVSPITATLGPSQLQQLTATISGTTNAGVSWSLNPAVGTISTAGATAVYNAPSIIDVSQTVEVQATSMADPTKIAKALLTLVPAVFISVTPSSATLTDGQTQQFIAQISGTTNTAVTWSLDQGIGSVSSTGLYTAPSPVRADQTLTLTAQSAADPTKRATSTVSLAALPQLQFTIDANHLTSLSYGGQSFYQSINPIVQSAIYQAPDGTLTDAGWGNPSSSTLYSNPPAFRQVYNGGQRDQFTVLVTWTQTDNRTLKAVAQVTNNDPTNTLVTLDLHLLPLTLPGPATQYDQNMPQEVNQYIGVPVSFLSGTWGSVAVWQSGYPTPVDLAALYSSASQTAFDYTLTTSMTYGPNKYSLQTPPGHTTTMTQLVRFGSNTDTAATLAPDAYSEYRTAFPNVVNWPDRHPIAYWMISDAGHASALNPRGYIWDPTIDITNTSTFQARVLSAADNTISVLNGMSVRPQGIIIWDLEGQEFQQPFTYVGYPNKLPELAPEMDAVADAFFARLTAAGYKVGVTVRPNHFRTGASLPSTCVYNTNYSLADEFILLSAPYPHRGYSCTATNTWSVSWEHGPSAQTTTQVYDDVLTLLQQKISYAHSRWGATLFYIDSSVWEGGRPIDPSIFRSLAMQFPDCLFIPEVTNPAHFGSTAPYNWSGGNWNKAASASALYPAAFQALDISNIDWSANMARLVQMVKSGDILLFPGWFSAPQVTAVQEIYTASGIR